MSDMEIDTLRLPLKQSTFTDDSIFRMVVPLGALLNRNGKLVDKGPASLRGISKVVHLVCQILSGCSADDILQCT